MTRRVWIFAYHFSEECRGSQRRALKRATDFMFYPPGREDLSQIPFVVSIFERACSEWHDRQFFLKRLEDDRAIASYAEGKALDQKLREMEEDESDLRFERTGSALPIHPADA